MNDESSPPIPPHGRLISAGMAAAAAIGLLLNHFTIESQQVGKLLILALAPIALFLGLGGMVEPKILWSAGKFGTHLPAIYKLMAGALGGLGVAVTLLLLLFVYGLGPPEPKPKPAPRLPRPAPTAATAKSKANSNPPPASSKPVRPAAPQAVTYLTYDRTQKRWAPMNAEALQGVRREDAEGVTTLNYAEGAHALLKVLWPDVLQVGDRFTVEVQGANSLEMVDLDGADANARASLPPADTFVHVEIVREKDRITFFCNGQPQKTFYASGKLKGDDAKSAILSATLRAGFSVKKGGKAGFQNAQIVRP